MGYLLMKNVSMSEKYQKLRLNYHRRSIFTEKSSLNKIRPPYIGSLKIIISLSLGYLVPNNINI